MIERIKEVVKELNVLEAERLKKEGSNSCFFNSDGSLTESYKWKLSEKKKYFYLNCGTSGCFMVSKEEIKGFPIGSIFNIKSYGTANFNKCLGQEIDVKFLHSKRYNYLR